jgi:mRNA interferase MazF
MGMVKTTSRFDIWLVSLDPTEGSEIQKTRPALIVSPDEMNKWLRTVIVAPMTTSIRSYPSRVPVSFKGKEGQVALDQLKCIDKSRLVKRLGRVESATANAVSDLLVEMFRV